MLNTTADVLKYTELSTHQGCDKMTSLYLSDTHQVMDIEGALQQILRKAAQADLVPQHPFHALLRLNVVAIDDDQHGQVESLSSTKTHKREFNIYYI